LARKIAEVLRLFETNGLYALGPLYDLNYPGEEFHLIHQGIELIYICPQN